MQEASDNRKEVHGYKSNPLFEKIVREQKYRKELNTCRKNIT